MNDPTAAAAKQYLQANEIPQLFEGIMTGLIHHKPENPIDFMEHALWQVRSDPTVKVTWDMFIREPPPDGPSTSRTHMINGNKTMARRRVKKTQPSTMNGDADLEDGVTVSEETTVKRSVRRSRKDDTSEKKQTEAAVSMVSTTSAAAAPNSVNEAPVRTGSASRTRSADGSRAAIKDPDTEEITTLDDGTGDNDKKKGRTRRNRSSPPAEGSAGKKDSGKKKSKKVKEKPLSEQAAVNDQVAEGIPAVPVILFMGGPGVHKTRLAARAVEEFAEHRLVHVCAPDLIRDAIQKRREGSARWREAERKYEAGELIAADLALQVIKEEMTRTAPNASAYLLEGFPRELQQVHDFEKQIKNINLAIILDFDEVTLRDQMVKRGLKEQLVNQRLQEYKMKTLPAAKFFDDKMLLHLIAGEQTQERVLSQIRVLIRQALGLPSESIDKPPSATSRSTLQNANMPQPENAPSDNKGLGIEFPQRNGTKQPVRKYSMPSTKRSSENEGTPPPVLDLNDVPRGLPNDAPVILVVGAPGVNKAEYCKRICGKYDGFVHLSMGDILRQEIGRRAKGDPFWTSLQEKQNKGEYLPIAPCRKLLYDAIQRTNKAWGYVIDGYPRTIEQAKDFEEKIERIDMVLLIDVTENYAMSRLRERASKALRGDDTEAAGKSRLGAFKVQTLRMLKYFEDKNKLKVTEGEKAFDEVFADIANTIDTTLFIPNDLNAGDGQSLDSSKNSKKA